MNFDEYQKFTKTTAVYPKIGQKFVYPMLGLSGEVGEVSEKIKKLFRDKKGKLSKIDREEIAKEMGDVLWYLSQLATELGIGFSKIAEDNVSKLKSRQQRNKLHGSGDNR